MLQFHQYCHRSADICLFLWLKYCKLQVELLPQQKVMKEAVAAETVMEGPLVERFVNERRVI